MEAQKQKYEQYKKNKNERDSIKREAEQAELEEKLEVNAVPLYDENDPNIKDINYKKKLTPFDINEMRLDVIDIQRTKKNKLQDNYDYDRPDLRDYN